MLNQIVIDPSRSNWVGGYVDKNTLYDEIEFLQYGQNREIKFEKISYGSPEPSLYIDYPTKEKPEKIYKLASIWLEQGLNELIIER